MTSYDPARLDALGKRHRRLKNNLKEVVDQLTPEVEAAIRAEVPIAEIARRSGYTYERIRQIAVRINATPP